ncbi:MAG: tetratricopeptide repeat protein, partial [Planctomycetota bacterium]
MFVPGTRISWILVVLLAVSGGLEGAEVTSLPPQQPQAQDPAQEARVALEQARILENVEGDYEKALRAYRQLMKSCREIEINDQAVLGFARCQKKLGLLDKAKETLQSLLDSDPSDVVQAEAQALIGSIEDLQFKRSAESSPVDDMVLQLLEAASSTDENRAKSARTHLEKMGALSFPILREVALEGSYFQSVTAFTILADIGGDEISAFFMECAEQGDIALRKRCVDGLPTERKIRPELAAALIPLLHDVEEPIRETAMDKLLSLPFEDIPNEVLHEIARILCRYFNDQDSESRDKAYLIIWEMAEEARAHTIRDFPVAEISSVIEQILDRIPPDSSLTDYEKHYLDFGMETGLILGTHYGHESLLQRIAQYWRFADPYRGVIDHYADLAKKAAVHLGDEFIRKLAGEIESSGNEEDILKFVKLFSTQVIKVLPEELWLKFLTVAARKGLEYNLGKFDYYLSLELPPEAWAMILNAVLESPVDRFRHTVLQKIHYCPDPDNRACMDVLCQWASHPDDRTRNILYQGVIKNWVKEG